MSAQKYTCTWFCIDCNGLNDIGQDALKAALPNPWEAFMNMITYTFKFQFGLVKVDEEPLCGSATTNSYYLFTSMCEHHLWK